MWRWVLLVGVVAAVVTGGVSVWMSQQVALQHHARACSPADNLSYCFNTTRQPEFGQSVTVARYSAVAIGALSIAAASALLPRRPSPRRHIN
jgi:hypothetical protein